MPVLDEVVLGEDRGIVIKRWRFRVSNPQSQEISMSGEGAFDIKDPRLPNGDRLDDADSKELDVTVEVGGSQVNWSDSRDLPAGQSFEKAGWTVTATGVTNDDDISSAAQVAGQ